MVSSYWFTSDEKRCAHSHEKRKDSLEGSLDRVLNIVWCNFSVKLPRLQRKGSYIADKIKTTLFDRHYLQNCKSITFRKIAIIPNGNKLMLQVIFIFSDWILTEQIIASSNPFCLGGNRFSKNSTRSFEWGTGAWVKKHRFNDFLGMWTP